MTCWMLEVIAANGEAFSWKFDEAPKVRSFYNDQVAMYRGTWNGQPMYARIVITSVVAWTTRECEGDEEEEDAG
jgi:hypothetical protein